VLVKTALGNQYDTYFTPTTDALAVGLLQGLLKLLHYNDVFLDKQIIDGARYRRGKEKHINSLLRRLEECNVGVVDCHL
jgi:hypothetical protein